VRGALLVRVALVGVALAGCGDNAESPQARTESATRSQPDPRSTPDPTELEIRQVANAYLKAFAREDWSGVCATLAASERRYFDRLAGSCERPFRQGGREAGKRGRRQLANSLASAIRIGPDQAVIEITEAGWREPFMRLYAIEEYGRWGIARSKKQREG
jgi:hypothetical protein